MGLVAVPCSSVASGAAAKVNKRIKMAKFCVAFILLLVGLASAAPVLPIVRVPSEAPYYSAATPRQTTYDEVVASGLTRGSDDLPATDPRVAPGDTSFPEQIQLAYQSPTSVVVGWVTGDAVLKVQADPLAPLDPNSAAPSIVQYGTVNGSLTSKAYGVASTYSYFYNQTGKDPYNISYPATNTQYASPYIHSVTLSGLSPSTTYYYQVGDGVSKNSAVFSFKTLQPLGPNFKPYRIAVWADIGQTYNSSVTVDHMTQANADVVLHIADYSYADDYCSNGVPYTQNGCGSQTYQPIWDREFRLMQPLLSKVAMLGTAGNHEIEKQSDGRQFTSFLHRTHYPTTIASNGVSSNTQLYYSADLPGVHTIWLNPYIQFDSASPQYQWLVNDLKAVDRTVTPWLFVMMHPPYYNSYTTHYKEQECFRETYEDIFYQYGVDAVLHGHVHAYERTNRVNNYQLDACASFKLTIGDGGNIEKLYNSFADAPGNCPATPNSCPTYQNGSYCYSSQPEWSAYREPSFGHATLDMLDANTAVWNWHRNQDGEAVVFDSVVFKRSPSSQCPNHALPVGATCDNVASHGGLYPNQCFNNDGSFFVCCPGQCPNNPGPIPYCAGSPMPQPGQDLILGQAYPKVIVTNSSGH